MQDETLSVTWPNIETRILRDGPEAEGDCPPLLVEDRVMVLGATLINGQKTCAVALCSPGLHRDAGEKTLIAMAEVELRSTFWRLSQGQRGGSDDV